MIPQNIRYRCTCKVCGQTVSVPAKNEEEAYFVWARIHRTQCKALQEWTDKAINRLEQEARETFLSIMKESN